MPVDIPFSTQEMKRNELVIRGEKSVCRGGVKVTVSEKERKVRSCYPLVGYC